MLEAMLYISLGIIGAAIILAFLILSKKDYVRHDPANKWGNNAKRGVQLGMEETDMNVVNRAEQENQRLIRKHRREQGKYL